MAKKLIQTFTELFLVILSIVKYLYITINVTTVMHIERNAHFQIPYLEHRIQNSWKCSWCTKLVVIGN